MVARGRNAGGIPRYRWGLRGGWWRDWKAARGDCRRRQRRKSQLILDSTRRPNLSYAGLVSMTSSAEHILEQIRALAPAERLQVVERVIHEMAEEVTPHPVAATSSLWSDEPEADFEAFQSSVQQLRAIDVWRASDAQDDC